MIVDRTFRPTLLHCVKSALVAWGWLPGWLHVRWQRETMREFLSQWFPSSSEATDA